MFRRLALLCLLSTIGLATYPVPLTVAAAAREPQASPRPPGRLIDVGGWKLHVRRAGKGGPAVVIEAGSADFSFDWALVTAPLSRYTTVCSYDRAGYAWSDPGPRPRTFQQLAWELRTALRKDGVPGPYVLVGQSYGGFLVRAFAHFYPDDVVGMVLVESMSDDSRVVINGNAVRLREMATGRAAPAITTHFSAPRRKDAGGPSDATLEPPFDRLPPAEQALHRWAASSSSYVDAVRAELDWSPEDIARMYRDRSADPHPLGDKPLVVITRAEGGYTDVANATAAELEAERLRLQADLAGLSTNSKQIIDAHSGHNVHLEDPATVVEAIRDVLQSVRRHTRLLAAAKGGAIAPVSARD